MDRDKRATFHSPNRPQFTHGFYCNISYKTFLNDLSDNAALLYFSKPEQFKPDTTMACEFGVVGGNS